MVYGEGGTGVVQDDKLAFQINAIKFLEDLEKMLSFFSTNFNLYI